MKRLLSMLFSRSPSNGTRSPDDWWNLSVSEEGEPPTERRYMYPYTLLLNVIKSKLDKLHK